MWEQVYNILVEKAANGKKDAYTEMLNKVCLLQDDFIQSLFEKTQNAKLLPAMKSFMELHQGICYVTDTGEPVQLDLSYRPEDLSKLDEMSLTEFVKTVKAHRCSPTVVLEDSEIRFY